MLIYLINGYEYIKNGQVISDVSPDDEDDNWIYNRIDNALFIETDYDSYKDTLKYSNMGKNFTIYTGNEIIHTYTGIQLDRQNNVSENTKLIVDVIDNGDSYDSAVQSIGSDYKNSQFFDITLKDEENLKIQPNGKVKISIPIKENMDTSKLAVYRIEDNGNKVQYDVNIVNKNNMNYVEFETDHFSIYALAEKTTNETTEQTEIPTQTDKENPEHILDDEPKTGTHYNFLLIFVGLVSIVCLTLCIKFQKGVK